jgi:hypothetical protein
MRVIVRADTNEHGELTRRELQQAFRKRGKKLFGPSKGAEMRRFPRGGGPPPFGVPAPPYQRPRPGGESGL